MNPYFNEFQLYKTLKYQFYPFLSVCESTIDKVFKVKVSDLLQSFMNDRGEFKMFNVTMDEFVERFVFLSFFQCVSIIFLCFENNT